MTTPTDIELAEQRLSDAEAEHVEAVEALRSPDELAFPNKREGARGEDSAVFSRPRRKSHLANRPDLGGSGCLPLETWSVV